MVRHLLQRRSPGALITLLTGMQTRTLDDAFLEATGRTPQRFFDEWIATLAADAAPGR